MNAESQPVYPVIGLTGFPCSGKSLASKLLSDLGARIIDVDKIGHQALKESEVIGLLQDIFDESILDKSGEIDRNVLGGIVFSNPEKLLQLEGIVHPWMKNLIAAEVKRYRQNHPVVIDAALLHHMGLDSLCEKVVLINASFELRLARAHGRGWNAEELKKRDTVLMEKIKPDCCITLNNNSDIEQFKDTLTHFYKEVTDE